MKKIIYIDSLIVNQFLVKIDKINSLLSKTTKKAEQFRNEHKTVDESLYSICNYHKGDILYILENDAPNQEIINEYNRLNSTSDIEAKVSLEEYISNNQFKYYFHNDDIIVKQKRKYYYENLTQVNLKEIIASVISDNILNLSTTNILIHIGSHRNKFLITDDLKYDYNDEYPMFKYEPDIIISFTEYDGNYRKLMKRVREIEDEKNQIEYYDIKCDSDENGHIVSYDIICENKAKSYHFDNTENKTSKEIFEDYLMLNCLHNDIPDLSYTKTMEQKYKQTEERAFIEYTSPVKETFVAIDTENENQIGYTVVKDGVVKKPVLIDFTKECPYKKEDVMLIMKSKFNNMRIVAHNAYIDAHIINSMFNEKLISEITDTLTFSRRLYGDTINHNLENIAAKFNIRYGKPHKANNDSLGCAMIMLKMLEENNLSSIEEASKMYNLKMVI